MQLTLSLWPRIACRLEWMKNGIFIAGVVLVVNACKKADEAPKEGPITPMKEYTVEHAREWTDIAPEHDPTAKKSIHEGKSVIIIEVPMPHKSVSHYIEKIGVMDMQGKELAVQALTKQANPVTYAYFEKKIFPWSGKVKIFAKCNLHDLWVKEINVRDLGI